MNTQIAPSEDSLHFQFRDAGRSLSDNKRVAVYTCRHDERREYQTKRR
jgi:hypothetical protein